MMIRLWNDTPEDVGVDGLKHTGEASISPETEGQMGINMEGPSLWEKTVLVCPTSSGLPSEAWKMFFL